MTSTNVGCTKFCRHDPETHVLIRFGSASGQQKHDDQNSFDEEGQETLLNTLTILDAIQIFHFSKFDFIELYMKFNNLFYFNHFLMINY